MRRKSVLQSGLERLRSLYAAMVRVRLPRIFGLVLRNPRDSLFAVALTLAITAIVANGLYLQPRRHPAPIFAERPLPVASFGETGAGAAPARRSPDAAASRREPPSRREQTLKNDPAPRNDAVPIPRRRTQTANAVARVDAIETPSTPSQIAAVQRLLNQAGYGPIKVNGILDDSTREGIARFEGDHKMPVTGQNTPRVRHALGLATGRLLD